MAAITVHRNHPGEDIDQIVASINQLQAAIAELQTVVKNHITDGKHRTAASVDAAATLPALAAPDTIVLGY